MSDEWGWYRLTYQLRETRTVKVMAASESAARQYWIDEAEALDAGPSEILEVNALELLEVEEL